MRLKVPFYGFALALIGFLIPPVVFAAFLPSLINAEPVKKRFIEELKSWAGADVELKGDVAIESFFSLSLNTEDVEFAGFRGLPALKSLRADEIVARISWVDLLSGNLDFDKIKINDASLSLRAMDKEQVADALHAALGAAHQTPFAIFLMTNGQIEIEDGLDGEPERANLQSLLMEVRQSDGRVRLNSRLEWGGETLNLDIVTNAVSKPGLSPSVPLRIDADSRLLTGSFNGEMTPQANWRASGQLSASTPNAAQLSTWLGWQPEFASPQALQVSASLDLSQNQIQLQSGVFTVAQQDASGDLRLVHMGETQRVEGALAFDGLDLASVWANAPDFRSSVNAAQSPLARFFTAGHLDLRISANQIRWGEFEMGKAAFTLTGREGVISAEIAQLGLFAGAVLGHAEADLRVSPPRLEARLTAEKIDAGRMAALVSAEEWLTGQADANISAQAEGWTADQLIRSAKAKARIEFLNGGQMRLDPLQLAQTASEEGKNGWNADVLSWWPFAKLNFRLSLEDDRLHWSDLAMTGSEAVIHGAGAVDLDTKTLNWQLKVMRAGDYAGAGANDDVTGDELPETNLSIKGPWARPFIRLGADNSRADAKTPLPPAARLDDDRLLSLR